MQAKQGVAGSKVFRDFEIQKILGSGGFGVVLRVQHKNDKKKYAIKLNIHSDSHTANEVKNFARIPAHDNVVGYFNSWMDTITMAEMKSLERIGFSAKALRISPGVQQMQLLCIQMELCGQDLRHWLRQQTNVNDNKCRSIFQQLLKGLQHIHKQGLIHRDLKPDNIFFALNNPDKVKIGDFGIAAIHQGTEGAQHTRGFGTILYLAPEQYTSKYGRKADLYAMGLILYEIYHPPAQRTLETSLTHLKNEKLLPKEFKTWPEISHSILSLLQYEPNKRPTIENLSRTLSVKKAPEASKVDDMETIQKVFGSVALGDNKIQKPKAIGLQKPKAMGLQKPMAMGLQKPKAMGLQRAVGPEIVKHDVMCDGCKASQIYGTRYKCNSCDNFDYCSTCYKSALSHRFSHEFTVIRKPGLGLLPAVYDKNMVHLGFECNGCKQCPIIGRRYVCQSCTNFNFCRNCYISQSSHRERHNFSLIKDQLELPNRKQANDKALAASKVDNIVAKNTFFGSSALGGNEVQKPMGLGHQRAIGPETVMHDVMCDGCKVRLITGTRYKCNSCDNFDYCSTCYRSALSHRFSHEFTAIKKPGLGLLPAVYDNDMVHHGYECNGCKQCPIKGRRYVCQSCTNFNFCRNCYISQSSHRESHNFSLIKDQLELPDKKRAYDKVNIHSGTQCTGCRVNPIKGIRYKCKSCIFFDFCQACYNSSMAHTESHDFQCIPLSNATCDSCHKAIRDTRYKCKTCPNFDSCENCYKSRIQFRTKRHDFRPISTCAVHNEICNSCKKAILGTRHKCKTCSNFNYCYRCYFINENHRNAHPFDIHYK